MKPGKVVEKELRDLNNLPRNISLGFAYYMEVIFWCKILNVYSSDGCKRSVSEFPRRVLSDPIRLEVDK